MIKIKCDICKEEVTRLNILVLYRKKIDYCDNPNCHRKALKLRKELEKEVKVQNIYFNSALKKKENQLIRDINKGGKDGRN